MKSSGKKQITLADLKDEEAIFRAVRNKCIQSPFTTIPLAMAAGVLLLTAAFGFGALGVFAAFTLAVAGLAAFVYNMWIRGETLTRKHVKSLISQLKQDRQSALQDLATLCEEIKFHDGAKEARELSEAYLKYSKFLEQKSHQQQHSAHLNQRLTLAESARAAGIEHLRRAADIHTALAHIDISKLRSEKSNWLAELENSPTKNPALTSKIEAHSIQIQRYQDLCHQRDNSIARANELEAALNNALMAEAGRSKPDLHNISDNPATRLFNAVANAENAEADLQNFLRNTTKETSPKA